MSPTDARSLVCIIAYNDFDNIQKEYSLFILESSLEFRVQTMRTMRKLVFGERKRVDDFYLSYNDEVMLLVTPGCAV